MLAVELDITIITEYYSYEDDKALVVDDIDKTELLLRKTDFLYSYSDIVLQLQNVYVNKDDFEFDQYELEIHCNTYGLARAKSLLFDPDKDEFFEEENN